MIFQRGGEKPPTSHDFPIFQLQILRFWGTQFSMLFHEPVGFCLNRGPQKMTL